MHAYFMRKLENPSLPPKMPPKMLTQKTSADTKMPP